jgi:hypothetical protein
MTFLSKAILMLTSAATLAVSNPALAQSGPYGGDYGRSREHRGDGVGGLLAGALVIGGIAAIASSGSRNRGYNGGRYYGRGIDRGYGNRGYHRGHHRDHDDCDRDRRHGGRGYDQGYGRGYDNRGYSDRGYDNRGYDNRGYDNRGYDNRGYGNDRDDDDHRR